MKDKRYLASIHVIMWGPHFYRLMLVLFFSTFCVVFSTQAKDDNLHFQGVLVSEPCTLDPNTTNIVLDFGTIVDKYLYSYTRTNSQPFTIRLLDCDTTLGSQVIMNFRGTESSELPGLLALSGGLASGVAIGMEMSDGMPLPFNRPTPGFQLVNGTTDVTLKAFVQGEPSALMNHNLGHGEFTAMATFELDYP